MTTTAAAALGTTSISVSSFTANANYGGGTTVAYLLTAPTPAAGGPWATLFDRTVLAAPLTKTASQTATLELDLGFSN